MTLSVPAELVTRVNQQVLGYIADLSAHSDVADALALALKPLGDVQSFCPDPKSYRYVAASTKSVIFAIAIGMDTVGVRLDDDMKDRALSSGASAFPECGEGWVSFRLFRSDWPKVDLEFWTRKAYVAARQADA
jgi:hypothetical protein